MAGRRVPAEIEAKLSAAQAADLAAIAARRRLGPYRLRERDIVSLHSLYLDTPALTLVRHGVALRVRRAGRRWEMTAKWAGRVRGVVHDRPELTVALRRAPHPPFVVPEGALRERLGALLAGDTLRPIVITEITRRHIDVWPDGAATVPEPLAEIALDRVQVRAPRGRRALRYYEVEVERRGGRRRDVTALARLLRARFRLTPSRESKFARGLRLIRPDAVTSFRAKRRGRTPATPRSARAHHP